MLDCAVEGVVWALVDGGEGVGFAGADFADLSDLGGVSFFVVSEVVGVWDRTDLPKP